MGIGRREFLRLLGAGVAAAIADSSSAIDIVADHYVNRKLGIAFQKPADWVFADYRQMGDMKAGQILDHPDIDFLREMMAATRLPILTISRDGIAANSDHFTPGVTVHLERLTAGELDMGMGFQEPVHNLEVDVGLCEQILKKFCVTSPPESTCVSGCEAAEYEASFTFEHKSIEPTPVRMKSLTIEQGTAFYTIRLFDSPYLGGEMAYDYKSFIASIRMV